MQLGLSSDALSSATASVADRHRSVGVILGSCGRGWTRSTGRVLSELAIFVGGFTREGAAEVAGATLGSLATLTERAMIQRLPDASGGSSYLMHELVRSLPPTSAGRTRCGRGTSPISWPSSRAD